jgi:predicted murein hydrolase (TIGR00659 family)
MARFEGHSSMTNSSLWVHLVASPLLWLTVTVLAWVAATSLARRCGGNPLVNPVLISVVLIICLLEVCGVDYGTYFSGAQFIHFLLGPATVALGVPLFRRIDLVKANLLPMLAALLVGSLTAVGSVLVLGAAFHFPEGFIVSMAPKSATAAVAMAISSALGGNPSLTAALVIVTGILGAVIVTPFMNAMKITDYSARGFAAGLASHGIGTARAYAVDPVAGLFAGVAMALNAVMTSLVVPLLL